MENMDQNNVNVTTTPVEVPETKTNLHLENMQTGAELGMGYGVGLLTTFGVGYAIYKGAQAIHNLWKAGKEKRAAKKAAKEAEKANEKPSKKKAGED